MNPLTPLDTILSDYASPRVRRLIHSLLVLAAVVGAIWVATDGNWVAFAGALAAAFYAEANRANTDGDANDETEEDDNSIIAPDLEDVQDGPDDTLF